MEVWKPNTPYLDTTMFSFCPTPLLDNKKSTMATQLARYRGGKVKPDIIYVAANLGRSKKVKASNRVPILSLDCSGYLGWSSIGALQAVKVNWIGWKSGKFILALTSFE